MKFADRAAAGRQLAPKLAPFKDRTPVVLAPPRGAVAVGFEIAQALGAPRSSSMTALPPVPRCGCAVRRRDPAHLVRAVPVAPPECWGNRLLLSRSPSDERRRNNRSSRSRGTADV